MYNTNGPTDAAQALSFPRIYFFRNQVNKLLPNHLLSSKCAEWSMKLFMKVMFIVSKLILRVYEAHGVVCEFWWLFSTSPDIKFPANQNLAFGRLDSGWLYQHLINPSSSNRFIFDLSYPTIFISNLLSYWKACSCVF
eukprot:TRINITY_DN5741_c0_g1_i1.p1 TRINITY_DN5741_c0_g1~~TRINITY_DN5741_c0_g1_i1.p1  ORF type:complete len:138 (-),score=13.13 TRINITY_DN5741_c0_g1_i1:266-679(-)